MLPPSNRGSENRELQQFKIWIDFSIFESLFTHQSGLKMVQRNINGRWTMRNNKAAEEKIYRRFQNTFSNFVKSQKKTEENTQNLSNVVANFKFRLLINYHFFDFPISVQNLRFTKLHYF